MENISLEIENKKYFFEKVPKVILIVDHTFSANISSIESFFKQLNIKIFDYNKTPLCDITPDLIILVNKTFRFNINNPLLLAKAELHHYESLSIDIFLKCLNEYSKAVIKNGL
ncbi:hypothetical protein DMUE_1746 [Dictyocoela muelleri]|nr:hypothetical protein DMUE_1746 [Dictyocoela muelleri]